jgi:hypothetical protein
MTEEAFDATVRLVTVKVAAQAPPATGTFAGTVAAVVVPLVRVTEAPPLGAGAFSVTVPVVVVPPFTLVIARANVELAGEGVTISAAVLFIVPSVAVIVLEAAVAAVSDVTVNVATLEPAGTITLAGAVTSPVEELASVTVVPAPGAVPVKVTVPVGWVAPPTTEGTSSAREERAGAVTVSVAVFVTPE